MRDLTSIDPQWAWSEYLPDPSQPWNRSRAAHLFRRAGFMVTSRELDEAVKRTPAELVSRMIAGGAESAEFRREIDDLAQTILASGDPKNLSAWWVYRLIGTPDQLLEKTTLFWHGHFATSAEKVQDAQLIYQQNELLRQYALGDFAELAQAMSKDPAMLIYLDSATNRKAHPNENYARELMELFCLGEGNYSEADVQQLARCFTGWEVRRDKFRFNRYQHDFGSKTILGQTGEFSGEDGVQLVVANDAAPRFLVRKLIRFFVFDEPQPSDALVEPLARELRDNDLYIAPTIQRILTSRLFFSEAAIAQKVRSPVELAVGLLRALEGTTNVYRLAEQLAEIGQGLFYPPNVKGWDGGRTWINSSTLLGRANMVHQLLTSDKTRFAGGTLDDLLNKNGIAGAADTVDWLLGLLFAVEIPGDVRGQLVSLADRPGADRHQRVVEVIYAMSALPEFQLV